MHIKYFDYFKAEDDQVQEYLKEIEFNKNKNKRVMNFLENSKGKQEHSEDDYRYSLVAKTILSLAELKFSVALKEDLTGKNDVWQLYNEAGNEFINAADYYLMAGDTKNACLYYNTAADSITEGSKSCKDFFKKNTLKRKAEQYYEKAKTFLSFNKLEGFKELGYIN